MTMTIERSVIDKVWRSEMRCFVTRIYRTRKWQGIKALSHLCVGNCKGASRIAAWWIKLSRRDSRGVRMRVHRRTNNNKFGPFEAPGGHCATLQTLVHFRIIGKENADCKLISNVIRNCYQWWWIFQNITAIEIICIFRLDFYTYQTRSTKNLKRCKMVFPMNSNRI